MFRFITNITTTALVLFNTYNQFKAKKEDKAIKKLYDIYFKVMCIFLVIDNLLSFILRIVPFYQLFKLLLIIWLSVPKCSGSVFIYRFYVNGFMRTYEKEMDKTIEKFKEVLKTNLERYKEFAYGKIKQKKGKAQVEVEDEDKEIMDVMKGEIEGTTVEDN